ncbi:MAG TPA: hypothetical protein PL190_00225 [Caldisericia bacterium]|nr:hypothetical protein [Caldisericia bacterium]HOC79727.1 hypothetical protein [Caldisericia bacterium]HOG69985.1 hypothetical protein [Caldisericia bacterium]HPA64953.1 hypothetical protein [Caldisericia bacterium]HPM44728.1 hypothetical protein [Caldisericia bacterium]
MRKIALVFVACALLASCGQAGQNPEPEKKTLEFPSTFKVESKYTPGEDIVVSKEGSNYNMFLGEDAKVFFDDKEVEAQSILKGQTIYVEGGLENGKIKATRLVITEWPGHKEKGKDIIIDPKIVPEMVSQYLSEKHSEFGVGRNTVWTKKAKLGNPPPGRLMDTYQYGTMLMVVTYDEMEDSRSFTVLITPGSQSPASWSGTINSDGSIEEFLYEKP